MQNFLRLNSDRRFINNLCASLSSVCMEPVDFYRFVLPLGVMIVLLASMVLYIARKEEPDEELEGLRKQLRSGTIDRKTYERMRNRLKYEKIFAEELEKLETMLQRKTIDQDHYTRLRKVLEMTFTKRLEGLDAHTRL